MLPGFLKGYMSNALTGALLKNTPYTFSSGPNLNGSGTTTSNGAYLIQLPAGTFTLTFNVSGYKSITITVTIPSGGSVTRNLSFTPN